jgi:hypothetical protein
MIVLPIWWGGGGESMRYNAFIRVMFSIAVLFAASTGARSEPCGDAPLVSDESLKGELDSRATVLSRLFGDLKFQGEVQIQRNDVLSRYPAADKLRVNQYFLYAVCQLIMADTQASLEQKIKMLGDARESISLPSAARSEWLQPHSFPLAVGDFAVPIEGIGGPNAVLNFTISNRSGVDVGVALQTNGFVAGPCTNVINVAGLPLLDSEQIRQLSAERDPAKRLRWFPRNDQITSAVLMRSNECFAGMFSGMPSVAVSVNLVIAAGRDVMVLPLSANARPRGLPTPQIQFTLPYSTR